MLIGAAILGFGAADLAAQAPRSPSRFVRPEPVADSTAGVAGRAFLFSVLVPGAGQRLQGQGRWVPYLALEVWAWLRYREQSRTGRQLERRYRDLAWSVARRISIGERRDGDFEYYEAMTQYRASGAFDVEPFTPGVQPERSPATYNGRIWELARAIYIPAGTDTPAVDSPEYQQALDYYTARATRPEFAWSWGENGLEQQAFAKVIHRSDEALRSATATLGVILANHLASAVDAFVTARLRAAAEAEVGIEVESGIRRDAGALRLETSIRIPFPRR